MSDIDALLAQGLAAVEAGEYEAARQIYEHCPELEPANTRIRVRFAKILLAQGKYQAALDIGLQVIESAKDKERGYTLAGMCYYHLGQLAEAEQMFRQAIAIKPYPWTLSFLYQVLLVTDREKEGMTCLQEILKHDPNYEEAHYNLGCCYNSRKEYELAEQHLRKAVEIDPDYALAYAELGIVLNSFAIIEHRENRPDDGFTTEAKRCLQRAIKLNPDNSRAQIYLANLLWRSGKLIDAEARYQAAVTRWPKSSTYHWAYGDFLSATHKDHAKARAGQLLRKAIELEPDNAIAHYYLGKHLLRCKHKFKANQALEKAAELGYQKAATLLEEIKAKAT